MTKMESFESQEKKRLYYTDDVVEYRMAKDKGVGVQKYETYEQIILDPQNPKDREVIQEILDYAKHDLETFKPDPDSPQQQANYTVLVAKVQELKDILGQN